MVIDTFDATSDPALWPFVVNSVGSDSVTDAPIATVAGNRRYVGVNATAMDIPGLDKIEVAQFAGGGFSLLDYASSSGATGEMDLVYRGMTPGAMILDLSSEVAINIDLLAYDAPGSAAMPIEVLLISDWTNPGEQSVTLSGIVTTPGAQTVEIALAPAVGNVDMTDIQYIGINFDAPEAADFRIDEISVVLPEPATVGLLGLGLTGIFVRRRRK
jgi:hypothetical protein